MGGEDDLRAAWRTASLRCWLLFHSLPSAGNGSSSIVVVVEVEAGGRGASPQNPRLPQGRALASKPQGRRSQFEKDSLPSSW